MLQTYDCLRTRSNIVEIKKLDGDILAISTQLNGVKLVNLQDCRTLSTITHDNLNANTKAICFSQNAEFMAFSEKSYIFILHLGSKIVLKTINTEGENIEHLSFDLESKYIIAATKSGRILQYRYDGSSLVARLYSYKRTKDTTQGKATSFSFHSNTIICGSSNGILFGINLHSRANKFTLQNDTAQINSSCIIEDSILASGDSKGNIYFNLLKDNTLIKKVETGFTTVKQIILLPNPNYMMVHSQEKNIAVYELTHFKLLHNKYMHFPSNIKKIIVADEDTLIVALEDNSIEKIALPKADKLKSYIVDNTLSKAFALVTQDPLLKGTKEYKVLELAYTKVYKAALDALVKQNNEKARELTKMFKYVDEKKEEIEMLFIAFKSYSRFKILYSEKKYALAYAMSAKFPPLEQTFQYKKMEEVWEEAFKNAQRQIAHGRIENAVTLLNEYATIAQKRPLIKLILKHTQHFEEFLEAIELKDFQSIERLASQNQLFTLTPKYKDVQKAMNMSLRSIKKDIQKCNIDSAVKKLSPLQNIASIAQEVSLHKDECKAIKKLQDVYKNNDFIKCFEIIDTYHVLNTTELGILLQAHWIKIIVKAEGFALKGNIKDIKITLGELISLKTRRDKIGDLFRLSFHTKMKALIHKKTYKKAESIIYSYLDIFGLDKEVTSIMRNLEKKSKIKLALTQNTRMPRDTWINSDLIMKV
ncbi:MAG: hypothetical protein COB42_07190 [Sulfurimonas sp.]|nr:MAG: hypothetical protein COB42_07190 [Sulfurimonas sp.]